MSVVKASLLHGWAHEDPEDAKAEILEALGDLTDFEVWGTQCLVADYVRPQRTRSGLITPGSAQVEDIYQGKVGLLVVIGPTAFLAEEIAGFGDDRYAAYNSRRPAVGDWVYFSPQHSVQLSVEGPGGKLRTDDKGQRIREWHHGWQCRLLYARDIYGRVKLPQMIV